MKRPIAKQNEIAPTNHAKYFLLQVCFIIPWSEVKGFVSRATGCWMKPGCARKCFFQDTSSHIYVGFTHQEGETFDCNCIEPQFPSTKSLKNLKIIKKLSFASLLRLFLVCYSTFGI